MTFVTKNFMQNREYYTINEIKDNPQAIETVIRIAPKIRSLAERIYEKIGNLERVFFVGL